MSKDRSRSTVLSVGRLILLGLVLTSLSTNSFAAKSCSVSASLAFGNYDPSANQNVDAVGSIDFYCNSTSSIVVKLNAGSGAGASYSGGRRMSNGKNWMLYNI